MSDVLVVVGVGGMGEAIARRTGAGLQVLLADFNESALEAAATRLRGDGFDVQTAVVDVSDQDSVHALASRASELGRVSKVAHTAGLSPAQAPAAAILQVDLLGVAHSLDAFGAVIADGGAGVVIASMAGTLTAGQLPTELEQALASTPTEALSDLPIFAPDGMPPGSGAYGLAKRANQLRVQAASQVWGARGGRVNTVSPGIISTPMGQQELASGAGGVMRAMIDGSAARRAGTSSDIAAAAAFLLSDDSRFITGTDLLVDGGVVAAVRTGGITLPSS